MIPRMTTREVLTEARALISDEENWCQGSLEYLPGQMCAVGAIQKAATGDALKSNPASTLAWLALDRVIGEKNGLTMGYNDASETTHSCIITAFTAAIENCND